MFAPPVSKTQTKQATVRRQAQQNTHLIGAKPRGHSDDAPFSIN